MAKKTAFVTGGTGFVGLNLIAELTRQGWSVTALHRPQSNLEYLRRFPADRVASDLSDSRGLELAMPEELDAVFHVAGSLNLWSRRNAEQDRININGTRHMVTAALKRRARKFVHTSSISVYGIHRGRVDETAEKLGGGSWINYQRSKFLAEKEVERGISQGLDAVMINPAQILGPYDVHGSARFIRMVHAGKLPGIPPGRVSFSHVREVARAHIAAVEHGRCGENYLLGGVDATYVELIRTIGEVAGRRVPNRPMPAWALRLVARAGHWLSYLTGKPPRITPEAIGMVTRWMFCDCSKAERELGFRAVDLRTMVEDSYGWLEAEGLLDLTT